MNYLEESLVTLFKVEMKPIVSYNRGDNISVVNVLAHESDGNKYRGKRIQMQISHQLNIDRVINWLFSNVGVWLAQAKDKRRRRVKYVIVTYAKVLKQLIYGSANPLYTEDLFINGKDYIGS